MRYLIAMMTSLVLLYTIYKYTRNMNTLYDRLGGIYNIAAVVNRFSDALIVNPMLGITSPNPYLKDWSNNHLDRLPGLKFMRTLWLSSLAGGPFIYHASTNDRKGKCPFSLENAHSELHVSDSEFMETARELEMALNYFKVPDLEKNEVVNAFLAHRGDVVKHITVC